MVAHGEEVEEVLLELVEFFTHGEGGVAVPAFAEVGVLEIVF